MGVHEQQYRRILDELAKAKEVESQFIGACRDCKHYEYYSSDYGSLAYCNSPLVLSHEFSEGAGKLVSHNMSAKKARAEICGSDGGLFEQHWWPFYNTFDKFSFWILALIIAVITMVAVTKAINWLSQ